jgi:hypothetical protein
MAVYRLHYDLRNENLGKNYIEAAKDTSNLSNILGYSTTAYFIFHWKVSERIDKKTILISGEKY